TEPRCDDWNASYNARCNQAKGHDGQHSFLFEGGWFSWPVEPSRAPSPVSVEPDADKALTYAEVSYLARHIKNFGESPCAENVQSLIASHERLRADRKRLTRQLEEMRTDAGRWRFIRTFLKSYQWPGWSQIS